jgi:hypothetical protein
MDARQQAHTLPQYAALAACAAVAAELDSSACTLTAELCQLCRRKCLWQGTLEQAGKSYACSALLLPSDAGTATSAILMHQALARRNTPCAKSNHTTPFSKLLNQRLWLPTLLSSTWQYGAAKDQMGCHATYVAVNTTLHIHHYTTNSTYHSCQAVTPNYLLA